MQEIFELLGPIAPAILLVLSTVLLVVVGDDFDKKILKEILFYSGIVLLVGSFFFEVLFLFIGQELSNFEFALGIIVGILRCLMFLKVADMLDEKHHGSGFIWFVFILNLILIFL